MKKCIVFLLGIFIAFTSLAQSDDEALIPALDEEEYRPLKLDLNQTGSQYIRFLIWGQFWLRGQQNDQGDYYANVSIRRMRMLTYAQVSPRFMILMHFGLNGLNDRTMDPLGTGALGPQLFLHDAWSEFQVVPEKLVMGIGLHYWNGISRLTNQSTLNFLTLDNYRRAWPTLGLSDQFARHLGIFANGMLGGFGYRLSANSNLINSLDVNRIPEAPNNQTLYTGKYEFEDDARWSYQGYFEYQFLDRESDKLPYKVGSYLGKHRVFNIGTGFFYHPNGSITYRIPESSADSVRVQNDVSHFAVDAFYDSPLGKGAITAYAAYYFFDYGPDYTLGSTYGTGSSFLVQAGYLIPGTYHKFRVQPYMALNTSNFDAFDNGGNGLRTGVNFFLVGHHAKFTLEYEAFNPDYTGPRPDSRNSITLQAQVYL